MTYEEALQLRAGDVFVYDNPNFSWQPPRTFMIVEVVEDKEGVVLSLWSDEGRVKNEYHMGPISAGYCTLISGGG